MYLSIPDAAQLLKMSRQWVHELINRGLIGTINIAGHRVVVKDKHFMSLCKKRAKRRLRHDYLSDI